MASNEYDVSEYEVECTDAFNKVRKLVDNLIFKRGHDPIAIASALSMCSLIIYDDIFDDDTYYAMILDKHKRIGQKLRKKEPL